MNHLFFLLHRIQSFLLSLSLLFYSTLFAAMFQQTFKNFTINLNTSEERNVYSGGKLVHGHVSFVLTKKTKITSITMALKGLAQVRWSTGGGGSGKRRRSRTVHSAKLVLFDLNRVISQNNRGMHSQRPPGCCCKQSSIAE